MMKQFDVVVIGSGPAGCTAASLLAKKGYEVALVEREKFPRFHVGESLLPATQEIWEELGIAEELQNSSHTFKFGADVRIGFNSTSTDYESSQLLFHNVPKRDRNVRPFAYQVERSVFDKQLQNCAVKHGVQLLSETAVESVLFEESANGKRAAGLQVRTKGQGSERIDAKFIIDASGRRCVIARQLGCIENDPAIKTSAAFGHYTNVQRDPGFRQGFIRVYFIPNGWIWLIPLNNNVMSVGVVQNEPNTLDWSNDPRDVLSSAINQHEFVKQHFKNAEAIGRVRSLRRLAYRTTEFCGDGWLSIGDANFFVDPLYSSGVHVAMTTGREAVGVVDDFLSRGRDQRVMQAYRKYILNYRRDVFGVIRSVYKMLESRNAIRLFIFFSGRLGRNFDTWFFRRVAAWSSGYFDRYRLVMRVAEVSGYFLSALGKKLGLVTGDPTWNSFASPKRHRVSSRSLRRAGAYCKETT